jgi:hypothetical protein
MSEKTKKADNDEPELLIDCVCADCGCIDPLPESIVAEYVLMTWDRMKTRHSSVRNVT